MVDHPQKVQALHVGVLVRDHERGSSGDDAISRSVGLHILWHLSCCGGDNEPVSHSVAGKAHSYRLLCRGTEE
jgi:hypothetical protein